MTDDLAVAGGSSLWRSLQKLSNGLGVQREDLLEALQGELSELRESWHINTDDPSLARNLVATNLRHHIRQLNAPTMRRSISIEEKKQLYQQVVAVNFNIYHDRKHVTLLSQDLMERREWLARKERGSLKVGTRTSDNYLRYAITQIEQQLLATGYEPLRSSEVDQQKRELVEPILLDSRPRRRRTIVSGVGVVTLAAIGVIAYALWPSANGSSASADKNSVSASSSDTTPGAPIAYTVTYGNPNAKACAIGLDYVFPFTADKMPPLPQEVTGTNTTHNNAVLQYAAKYHGIPTAGSMIDLAIQGTGQGAVVLTGLEVEVKARRPAISGSYETGGCGSVPGRSFLLSMADVTPKASPDAGTTDFPYQVSSTDSEVFQVWPFGNSGYVDYVLLLDWSYQGRSGQLTIDDHGKPFEYSGTGSAQAGYFDTSGKFVAEGH